ncbi:MAG: O-antigen ligase family protein [Candidatus Yanofskybacteria bacterium]|nr:O-antigen ligase family protein [Candidatus Yanofskybacteria bacterium]
MLAVYAVILFGFFLTFSRVIILVWGIVFWGGIMIYHKKYRQEVKEIFLTTLVVASLFAILFWPEILSRLTISGEDQAVELRSFYIEEVLRNNINFLGIGYGNFIGRLIKENPFLPAYAYQPVHNIYLLIYAETGLLGFSAFLLFLFFSIKNVFKSPLRFIGYWLLVIGLLFIGLFDHMFWTLQQGRLVFWFSVAGLTFYQKSDRI